MLFFSLVVMPALRQSLAPSQRGQVIQAVGRRYRVVGWTSIGVLLVTGPIIAWDHGVAWDSEFGQILGVKLFLVGVMLVLTIAHNLVLAPRVAQTTNLDHKRPKRLVIWLARVNILVVLGIIMCGVWLAHV